MGNRGSKEMQNSRRSLGRMAIGALASRFRCQARDNVLLFSLRPIYEILTTSSHWFAFESIKYQLRDRFVTDFL
jgi:hypothetical protein